MNPRMYTLLILMSFLASTCSSGGANQTDVDEAQLDSTSDDQDTAPLDTAQPDTTAPDIDEDVPVETTEDTVADSLLDSYEDTAQPDTLVDIPLDTAELSCETLQEGMVSGFMVDGELRQFILNLPSDADVGGPWAVIFNWHGYGDTASNMSRLLSGYVNNETMPFILVTPEDVNIQPPTGFDWDVLKIVEPNREMRLFDAVVACLEERYDVDEDHIHSVGFSAGSIAVDLLGVMRGDQIASIVSYSGGYFSNPDNVDTLGIATGFVSWPAPVPSSYAQVLLHGGQNDNYPLMGLLTIQFNDFAANDQVYLNANGHDVMLCDHGSGHTVPASFYAPEMIEFFSDHPRSETTSPYRDGLPGSYPEYCSFYPGNQ